MGTDSFTVTAEIPASPQAIYDAWLDGEQHGAMTGGEATVDNTVGGRHTAWDGYIEGTNLALEPGRRIVQSWRSLEFPEGSPDSRLEILLEATAAGTRVTITHTDIPKGQGKSYETGWVEHYFQPMTGYFASKA